MAKGRRTVEARIIDYFRTADLHAAVAMLNVVKAEMRIRLHQETEDLQKQILKPTERVQRQGSQSG